MRRPAVTLAGRCTRAAQAAWARAQQYALLAALRPDAVALVDAFGIEDYLLNSALGRADGDVYRALLAAARASPLNATQARARVILTPATLCLCGLRARRR